MQKKRRKKQEFQYKQIIPDYEIYSGQALTHERQEKKTECNKFISSTAQG